MTAPVFIGSAFVAKYPEGGGAFWVPLQYLLGLRHQGINAYWLELLPGSGNAAMDQARIKTFFARARLLNVGDRVVVLYLPEGREGERSEIIPSGPIRPTDVAALMCESVLINLSHSIPRPHRDGFALKILYDIDPGMFQLWSRQWDMGVGDHDLYATIGMSIGGPDCPVPPGDVSWHTIWPAVHLPSWPRQLNASMRYTTITQWWNGNNGYDLIDGELYEHNKRTSFLEYIDMPRRTGLELELAANVTPGEVEDRQALFRNGWRLVAPHDVAGTPRDYRAYIQASRGEFSCAKPSVIKASPGWVSDRTLCYLASGRPCVVQGAGAERHLPRTLGLQFFSTPEEAAEALRAVERDYALACNDARALAEEFFATRLIVPQILALIGLKPIRPRARSTMRQCQGSARVPGARNEMVEAEKRSPARGRQIAPAALR